MAVTNGSVVCLAPYCSLMKPFFIRCLMKVDLPMLHQPTRRILGWSQNPPAPASGTRGSRAAPPGTAALWVQWPQALGHHLEELRPLFVVSILADPAEHAAQNARGCKLGRGHRAQAGLTACPSTRQERLAPHTRTAGPAGTPQAWIICWGCGVFK